MFYSPSQHTVQLVSVNPDHVNLGLTINDESTCTDVFAFIQKYTMEHQIDGKDELSNRQFQKELVDIFNTAYSAQIPLAKLQQAIKLFGVTAVSQSIAILNRHNLLTSTNLIKFLEKYRPADNVGYLNSLICELKRSGIDLFFDLFLTMANKSNDELIYIVQNFPAILDQFRKSYPRNNDSIINNFNAVVDFFIKKNFRNATTPMLAADIDQRLDSIQSPSIREKVKSVLSSRSDEHDAVVDIFLMFAEQDKLTYDNIEIIHKISRSFNCAPSFVYKNTHNLWGDKKSFFFDLLSVRNLATIVNRCISNFNFPASDLASTYSKRIKDIPTQEVLELLLMANDSKEMDFIVEQLAKQINNHGGIGFDFNTICTQVQNELEKNRAQAQKILDIARSYRENEPCVNSIFTYFKSVKELTDSDIDHIVKIIGDDPQGVYSLTEYLSKSVFSEFLSVNRLEAIVNIYKTSNKKLVFWHIDNAYSEKIKIKPTQEILDLLLLINSYKEIIFIIRQLADKLGNCNQPFFTDAGKISSICAQIKKELEENRKPKVTQDTSSKQPPTSSDERQAAHPAPNSTDFKNSPVPSAPIMAAASPATPSANADKTSEYNALVARQAAEYKRIQREQAERAAAPNGFFPPSAPNIGMAEVLYPATQKLPPKPINKQPPRPPKSVMSSELAAASPAIAASCTSPQLPLSPAAQPRHKIPSFLRTFDPRNFIFGTKTAIHASEEEAHDAIKCPITMEVMHDPVLLIEDGHTYEKSFIDNWFEKSNTNPMTGAELKNKTYAPNRAIKSQCDDWWEKHPAAAPAPR